jgi:lipoprotein NlpI
LKHAARALLLAWLAWPAIATAEFDDHALLDLARERQEDPERIERGAADGSAVREARHALEQAHVPADADCAATIGAARFAALHVEFAAASAEAGDLSAAAEGYRHAHACRPRDANILAALAGVLFDARDLPGTRTAIDAALAIDPRSVSSNRIAANLDFVEERWADAISRFRYVASSDADRRQAGYGQLMYWLAQARAGIAKPEFVTRTPAETWPQPLLLYMRGEYTEAELVGPIIAGDRDDNVIANTSTDERLCEALFYVGEEHWARGQPDVARDYFAALVNLKVLYFLEHGLALAEIAKLRELLGHSQAGIGTGQ